MSGIIAVKINPQDIENLIRQIKVLSPKEKGLLFSMFFAEESKQVNIQRKDLYGSVTTEKEITDEDIKSALYNYNLS